MTVQNIIQVESKLGCQQGKTVLETLPIKDQLHTLIDSCRQGICQSCLMRSLDNSPPVSAQTGFKDKLKKQNYFYDFVCHPEQDMAIALSDQQGASIEARVIKKQLLSPDILRLVLS